MSGEFDCEGINELLKDFRDIQKLFPKEADKLLKKAGNKAAGKAVRRTRVERRSRLDVLQQPL